MFIYGNVRDKKGNVVGARSRHICVEVIRMEKSLSVAEIEKAISAIEKEYRQLERSVRPETYTEKRLIQSYEWDEDTGYSVPVTQPYERVEEVRIWREPDSVKKRKQELIAEKKRLLQLLEQAEDREAESKAAEIAAQGFYEVENPYESGVLRFRIPEQLEEALFFLKALGFPRAERKALELLLKSFGRCKKE